MTEQPATDADVPDVRVIRSAIAAPGPGETLER